MSSVMVKIRMKPELKEKFQALCEHNGLTLSAACRMFMQQAVNENRLPFGMYGPEPENAEEPNETTLAALAELEQVRADPSLAAGRYHCAEEMLQDVLGSAQA